MNPRNMSRGEKPRAMEALWESVSREEARLESPPWYQDPLRETGARHDTGKEQPIYWDATKDLAAVLYALQSRARPIECGGQNERLPIDEA
jgi:Putative addiction module component